MVNSRLKDSQYSMGALHFALASRKAKYISFFAALVLVKCPARAYRATHGRIQTFDRISGVDRLANQRRKGEKGDHVSPSLPPRAAPRPDTAAPARSAQMHPTTTRLDQRFRLDKSVSTPRLIACVPGRKSWTSYGGSDGRYRSVP